MASLIPDPLRAARLILQLRRQGIMEDTVLSALETVDRGAFLAPELAALAGDDCSVPIPCGQTIPRPLVTAQLLSALRLSPSKEERVLLIGSGSGYTAALLAHASRHVFGVERYKTLAEASAKRLTEAGLTNVSIRQGDGLKGLPERGPFDRILLAGAVVTVPKVLIEQLARDGRLVAPLIENGAQVLRIVTQTLQSETRSLAEPLSVLRPDTAFAL